MKIKRVNKISIDLEPWQAERLLVDINNVIAAYRREDLHSYPLALHDFREELKGVVDGQA